MLLKDAIRDMWRLLRRTFLVTAADWAYSKAIRCFDRGILYKEKADYWMKQEAALAQQKTGGGNG